MTYYQGRVTAQQHPIADIQSEWLIAMVAVAIVLLIATFEFASLSDSGRWLSPAAQNSFQHSVKPYKNVHLYRVLAC